MKDTASNIMFLTKYIWKFRKSIFIYIIFCGLVQALQLVAGIVGIRLILDFIVSGDIGSVLITIGTYVALNLICNIYYNYTNIYSSKAFSFIDMHVSIEMMKKATKVDFSCFDDSKFYDMYTRALSQASGAAQRLVGTYISIVSNLISVISIVTLMLAMMSYEFILLAFVNVIVAYVVVVLQNKWQFEFNMSMTRLDRAIGYFSGLFFNQGIAKEMRIFGSKNFFLDKVLKYKEESIGKTNQYLKKRHTPDYIKEIIFASTTFLTMSLATFRILRGGATVGIFVATINAVQSLTSQLQSLTLNLPSLSDQSRYIGNLRIITDSSQSIETTDDEQRILQNKESYKIEFRNVSFTYPNSERPVFTNLSFLINEGEHVCLVGENGAGKTTITKLLMRLYDPQNGSILIDNVDIKNYEINSVRACFSIVFQDSNLYSMSISENLFFSDAEANVIKASDSLESVNLNERFVKSGKFDNSQLTRLFDENGLVLSGGQMQRLFIARAFAKKSGLAILDEPSSSLDPMSEYELIETIERLFKNKTAIVVSHRLLFCRNMDKVLFLENGTLLETGTHLSLMHSKGKYYEMYEKQAKYYRETNEVD